MTDNEQVEARIAFYGWCCAYCGGPYQVLDHVKPRSRGGPDLPANLRPACWPCNTRKGAQPLKSFLQKLPYWRERARLMRTPLAQQRRELRRTLNRALLGWTVPFSTPPSVTPEDLLAVTAVAERLSVSTATVYKLIDRGELPHVRVSNAIRVTPADLEAYIGRVRR